MLIAKYILQYDFAYVRQASMSEFICHRKGGILELKVWGTYALVPQAKFLAKTHPHFRCEINHNDWHLSH
jgi:hypothetical protein